MPNLIEAPPPTAARADDAAPEDRERIPDPGGRGRSPGAAPLRPPFRRLLRLALAVSAAAHLFLLWSGRVPGPSPAGPVPEVTIVFEPVIPAAPERAPPDVAEPGGEPGPDTPAQTPGAVRRRPPAVDRPAVEAPEEAVARPRASERAPEARTIAPTTLQAPLAPLEATPGGIARRTTPADERRLEIMRAESLLAARLADLPGAGVPEDPSAGLAAAGGVTVPVPWGGFVPENRRDGVWREERCAGREADEADKPGEAEARRSQCE